MTKSFKVRIIPAYIGWAGISKDVRGAQLYYKSLLGLNRNTKKDFSYARLRQRFLLSGIVKFAITSNPFLNKYKFRDYLNINSEMLWILDRAIKALLENLDYTYCYDEIEEADINYYVNWQAFKEKEDKIDVGFFTHFDDGHKDAFVNTAKRLDYSVCMSKKYCDILQEEGVLSSSVIRLGFDTNFFSPKLIIGYDGGMYAKRKGLDLLVQLSKLDWVDLRLGEGKIPYKELPNFYRQLDYVLVPSLIEGGPMSLLLGLACGTPVVAPKDVGAVQEYNEGIIHYKRGDFNSLELVLRMLYEEKLKIRKQVENQTWDNFAIQHDLLFKQLMTKK